MNEHAIDLMVSYLEDTLGPGARREFESHLTQCAACAGEFMRVQSGYAAAAALLPDEVQLPDRDGASPDFPAPVPRGRRAFAPGFALAASVLAVAAAWIGYAIGTRGDAPPVPDDTRRSYVLLFEEPVWPPAAPLQRTGYAQFAQELREQGRFVGGERLTEEQGWRVLPSGQVLPAGGVNLSGWFIVHAESDSAALDMARRSPHQRWGSVLVRQVQ